VSHNPGKGVAGPAVTLQMMPKREDLLDEGEYADVEKQLHRHVLYQVDPGDVVVVDARGDLSSGIFGDMMMTYFKGRRGAGVVIDGCVRDIARIRQLDIPLWVRGATPNYHAQTNLMPYAVNVTVACGGVTVVPGDIIVADDDGAVCVPVALAEQMLEKAHKDHGWEEFSREKLLAGESLQRYYPLHQDAVSEYEAWVRRNGS
jgi:regulator of RNase E activity RraA